MFGANKNYSRRIHKMNVFFRLKVDCTEILSVGFSKEFDSAAGFFDILFGSKVMLM